MTAAVSDLSDDASAAMAELAELLAPAPPANVCGLPAGIHLGVPEDVYHRRELGVASKSALDQLHRSPAHYYAWVTGEAEDEDSPALRFGKAFHTATLEPSKYVASARTKKDRDDAEAIAGMVASVRRHPVAGPLVECCDPEVTLVWGASGVRCKGRLDGYNPMGDPTAFDLKSTSDASPEGFAKSVANYGYARQEAMYRDGLEALGEPLARFYFVAVEKAPPYAVAVYELHDAWVEMGRRTIARDLDRLAECCAAGTFPSYAQNIVTLEPPKWATT